MSIETVGYHRWKGKGVRIPYEELSVYVPVVLHLSAKAGHWETEKAGCKNTGCICHYGTSHKTCFDVVF